MSFVYLFDVKRSACGSVNTQSKNALCDTLTAYFCNPKFLPQEGRNGLFQPVKPYLLIRSINSQGCVSNYVEFTPKDACVNSKETRFLSPDECVAKTLTLMKNIERWDILPCMVYTFSSERMRMGGGNDNYYIRTVAKQNRASHKISEDGSVQAMAREIGIHVSKGKSIVVKECLFDERIHPTEALLLNASGVPYQKAQERPSEKLEENNPSPRL